MRQLALFAVVVLATLTAAYAAWELREAVVVLSLSLVGASAIAPVVDFWTARRLPRPVALALSYGLGLVAVALLLYAATGPVVTELEAAIDELATAYRAMKAQWPQGSELQRQVAAHLPSFEAASSASGSDPSKLAAGLLGWIVSAAGAIGELVVIVILSIFWSTSSTSFERLWLSLLPVEKRGAARDAWEAVKSGVGEQVRSDLVQSFVAMALLLGAFTAMDLPHPVLPAAACGLFRMVPLVGVFLAVGAAFLSAIGVSPLLATTAALCVVAVLILMELVIAPHLLRSRRYSPLLVTFLIVALTDAYGLPGLLCAPAAAAATQVFFERLLWILQPAPPPAEELSHLEERLEKLHDLVAERGERASPELLSVVDRLNTLVASAAEVA